MLSQKDHPQFQLRIAQDPSTLIRTSHGISHAVKQLSQVQVVISSWVFLDRLEGVELDQLEDVLVTLEDIGRELTISDKMRAYLRSKRSANSILKVFGIQGRSKDSLAVLLFTSGTESLPKGVPLTHHNILSNLRGAFEAIELYSDDIIYGFLPPFHAFGFSVCGILGLLSGIRTLYSPDPTDGVRLAKDIERWGITVTCGAPTFLKALLKASTPEQVKGLRMCASGAEKAPPELFQLMEQVGKEGCLIEGYGITECSPALTFNRYGEPHKGVGAPLPGVEVCVVHPDTLEPQPTGKQGLILVRGPNVFGGYLNPGLASPFVEVKGDSWYQTGDLGYLDEEGRLTISGRLKRFIKVGGEMVSLPAIEDALLQAALQRKWIEAVDGPTLAVCATEENGDKPKIYLFTQFALTTDQANEALRDAGFSNLVKIGTVIQLPELPVMGSGKIHYRKLQEQLQNNRGT